MMIRYEEHENELDARASTSRPTRQYAELGLGLVDDAPNGGDCYTNTRTHKITLRTNGNDDMKERTISDERTILCREKRYTDTRGRRGNIHDEQLIYR